MKCRVCGKEYGPKDRAKKLAKRMIDLLDILSDGTMECVELYSDLVDFVGDGK